MHIKSTLNGYVGNNDFTDSVKTYYQDLRVYSPIPREEERRLMKLAKEGDIEARNKIVSSNLRFVFEIAKKYRGNGVDIADLISEGNKGIMKAIDKFDMTKDVKFFTYAVWWIRHDMMEAIEEKRNKDANEVNFDDEFPCENCSIYNVGSSDDDESSFYYDGKDIEYCEHESGESVEDEIQRQVVVKKLLAKLDKNERVVIMKYFGIGDGEEEPKKFEEIGTEMNLSTERVRQLKIKAINSMRAEVFNISEANFLFD
jgi:RNA polymerase primary sigma factor